METKPARGFRFTHARLLEKVGDAWEPAACVVTRVAQGVVYYKLDGERKARTYVPVADFARIVMHRKG